MAGCKCALSFCTALQSSEMLGCMGFDSVSPCTHACLMYLLLAPCSRACGLFSQWSSTCAAGMCCCCRARLQIKKEEAELNRAFGAGLKAQLTKPDSEEAGQKLTTIQLFGDSKAVEIAMRMIDEAIDNREQKQKQRQKEYERKREVKRRERQLYHLRHARDYEALGLPMGASKIDVKKAYRWGL